MYRYSGYLLVKLVLTAIYQGWTRLDTLALLAIVFYIVYAILGALNTPVSTDEAKYYLVAAEVYAGRIPWVDIHPGPGGNLFYMLHMGWIKIAGIGYEPGRLLGIVLTTISVVAVYVFLRSYVNRYYIPLIWLFLYIFNPYIVFYSFLISHHSISNAFMIVAIISALTVWKKSQHFTTLNTTSIVIIALALLCGMAFGAMVSIRIHMALLIAVVAIFFLLMLSRHMCYKVLPAYIFGFLSIIVLNHTFFEFLAINQQSVVETRPVIEGYQSSVAHVQSLAENIEQTIELPKTTIKTLQVSVGSLPKLEDQDQLVESNNKSKIETTVLRNLRAADAQTIIKELNVFSQITNPEILQPLVKTLFGYRASSLFLVNIVLLIVVFIMFRGMQRDHKVLIVFFVCAGAVVFGPVFLFRFLLQASASYFYQSYFFLSILALFGMWVLLKPYAACSVKSNTVVSFVLFVLLVGQNFIFGTPRYPYENPTYVIFKKLGYVQNNYPNSLYNIKQVADLINSMSTKNDRVLVGNHGITPYLKAQHVQGTEVNMGPDFFSNYAVWLASENNLKSTPMGTHALEIDRMLKEGEIQYIVDRGFIHPDFFVRMKDLFCLKNEKFGYRIYAKCSKT